LTSFIFYAKIVYSVRKNIRRNLKITPRKDFQMGRRERQRENTREEIKSIARQHMREQGTASISLRAIARDMGLTVTALYRYYASRDDLITALILDAFNALADFIEAASHKLPTDQYANRLFALMVAYRQWALDNSADFQLIYGNPIPGYQAPAELTVAAARRSFDEVLNILGGALRAGQITLPETYQQLPPRLSEHMRALTNTDGYEALLPMMYVGVVGWARMHGMIMLELFDHTPPVVGDPDEFYRFEVLQLIHSVGLKPET
jgi:AcrR family transcriptional regulator